jgi:SNF2 family DNA or RNA helicase
MVKKGDDPRQQLTQDEALARWVTWNGAVALEKDCNERLIPTSSEILAAERKGVREIRGFRFMDSPSTELASIKFSRFPASLRLVVIVPGEGNGFRGSWRLEASGDRGVAQVGESGLSAGHLLFGESWHSLVREEIEEVSSLIRTCGLREGETLSLGTYHKLVVCGERSLVDFEIPSLTVETDADIQGVEDLSDIGLRATLYPYQKSGFRWLTGVANEGIGGILGDEMGLGKTLQVIALFLSEIALGRRNHLVIAPVTLLENWRRELAKFAPRVTPLVHQGPLRTGFPKILEGADVVLTSYETVARDLSLFEMINWEVVVLDEAQAIKNPQARRTDAVKQLRRRVGIAVTGTPVENRLRDLWSLMDFAVPGHLGTETEFLRHFDDSVRDAEVLEPLVTPLLLRRRVEAVAKDLPERIDIPQFLTPSDAEVNLYEVIRKKTIAEFGAAAALVNLTRLRMFCSHPHICDGGNQIQIFECVKLVRLLEILEEIFEQGEKALVFTSYTEMADIICRAIRSELGAGADTLDGRRPIVERQLLIDRFSSNGKLQCLVLNPRAAGAGLNITAANHVIHYNPEWNPATEDQATARSYRRGQTKPVTVHRLIYAGTVEEVILARLERKRELAEAAVVGGAGDELDRGDIIRALEMSPLGR